MPKQGEKKTKKMVSHHGKDVANLHPHAQQQRQVRATQQRLPAMNMNVPQYSQAEQMMLAHSHESIETQMPGNFHMAGDSAYGQTSYGQFMRNVSYPVQSTGGIHFGGALFSNSGSFPVTKQGSSGGLNPTSAEYVPRYPPTLTSNNSYHQPTVANLNANSSYSNNTSFGMNRNIYNMNNACFSLNDPMKSAYQPPSSVDSVSASAYKGFGVQPTSSYDGGVQLHGHSPVIPNGGIQHQNNYSVATASPSYGQQIGLGGGNVGYNYPYLGSASNYVPAASKPVEPPIMAFNRVGNLGTSFQPAYYGEDLNAQENDRTWGSAQNSYAVQSLQVPMFNNPANANRGKPACTYNSTLTNKNFHRSKPTSNLATAPVVKSITRPDSRNHSQPGGPVRAPSATIPSAPSPPMSRASEHTVSAAQDTTSFRVEPTPVLATKKHIEFKSEPRLTETPTLRRRGTQQINTDPRGTVKVAQWVSSVPHVLPGMDDRVTAPPPKMASLFAAGGIGPKTLTPIKFEADPFDGTSDGLLRAVGTNRFGPAPQMASYNGVGGPLGRNTGPSALLRALTDGGKRKPTLEEAVDPKNLPLAEYCRLPKPDEFGVIRITNIPYSVNRAEILAFLGRNARIVDEKDHEPVHIVMERVTSKTLDCYVEFTNFNEALHAVNRFDINRSGGRGGRLGQRHVEIELSSQEALMTNLFPKVKNVTWHGSQPVIIARDPNDMYNSGFSGFITKEELIMLVKHVEYPARSPFSKECPQRPFECLISTLIKYPWYMVDYITIEDRELLYQTTVNMIVLLKDRIERNPMDTNLTTMLFKRVWRAGLKCPGFSPTQKEDIVFTAGIGYDFAAELGLPPFADYWGDLWAIGPKPGVPYDAVFYYAAIIREATNKQNQLTLAQKAVKGEEASRDRLFGRFIDYVGLPWNRKRLMHMTLAQVAALEWAGIERCLEIALTPRLEQ